MMIDTLKREQEVITCITSAAARLIGICERDGREDLIDRAAASLDQSVRGLEQFRSIAGSDIGLEYTLIALRQAIGWMKTRDYASASEAVSARTKSSEAFRASMKQAMKDCGL